MNGTVGPQSEKVLQFCEVIKEKLNLEIVMWDERLTTVAAHRAMLEADMSRAKRKKKLLIKLLLHIFYKDTWIAFKYDL